MTALPAPMPAPALRLPDNDGKPVDLAGYRGKVVLLGFGFTTCPEVCPTTLAVLAQARKRLGPQADQVLSSSSPWCRGFCGCFWPWWSSIRPAGCPLKWPKA